MVSFIPSYWTWLHTGTSRVSVNPLHFFMDGSMHRMGLLRDEAELYNKEVFCIGALQQLQLKWTKLWSRRVLKIYVVLCCFSLHLSISNWLFFFFFYIDISALSFPSSKMGRHHFPSQNTLKTDALMMTNLVRYHSESNCRKLLLYQMFYSQIRIWIILHQ